MLSFLFVFSAILLLFGVRLAVAQDDWSALENHRVIISHIEIHILPVFNLQNTQENHFIARWGKSYASVGAGLRIVNLISAFGRVISLTVATPVVKENGVKGIQIVPSAER